MVVVKKVTPRDVEAQEQRRVSAQAAMLQDVERGQDDSFLR
jgi:hypothetical protein